MASLESEQIRAGFRREQGEATLSLEQERLAWEAASALAPLPDGIALEELDAGGVPAVWVRGAAYAGGRVLLLLHGGGYNAGSRLTHRAFASTWRKSFDEIPSHHIPDLYTVDLDRPDKAPATR